MSPSANPHPTPTPILRPVPERRARATATAAPHVRPHDAPPIFAPQSRYERCGARPLRYAGLHPVPVPQAFTCCCRPRALCVCWGGSMSFQFPWSLACVTPCADPMSQGACSARLCPAIRSLFISQASLSGATGSHGRRTGHATRLYRPIRGHARLLLPRGWVPRSQGGLPRSSALASRPA